MYPVPISLGEFLQTGLTERQSHLKHIIKGIINI